MMAVGSIEARAAERMMKVGMRVGSVIPKKDEMR